MSSLIKNLHIQNFKSVRDLTLECDRINIFIGKPNAGKSNVLEAISLLGAGYSEGRFMEGFVRYKTIVEMFSDFSFRNSIKVETDQLRCVLRIDDKKEVIDFSLTNINGINDEYHPPFWGRGISIAGEINSIGPNNQPIPQPVKVKKYAFKLFEEFKENGLFLHPPHGENFYLMVRSHKELREEINQFMQPNGLKLFLDDGTNRISLVRETEDGFLNFPLHLVPDTFQRYIFHLAAIMSNRDSVLLFEEPESHSYPPYVYQLAQYILEDEGRNQFFITTHNPYFLLPIMQEGKDVAVFVTWFKDYQTHARRLTEEELSEVLNYGVDLFLNLDHFIPE